MRSALLQACFRNVALDSILFYYNITFFSSFFYGSVCDNISDFGIQFFFGFLFSQCLLIWVCFNFYFWVVNCVIGGADSIWYWQKRLGIEVRIVGNNRLGYCESSPKDEGAWYQSTAPSLQCVNYSIMVSSSPLFFFFPCSQKKVLFLKLSNRVNNIDRFGHIKYNVCALTL